MTANIITLARVALLFVTIVLYGASFGGKAFAFILTILVIYMDALDGIVARKLNIASELGALLDITGDRIVENVYWIYFSAIGMVSFWVPMIVIARGLSTDLLRSIAFAHGSTPFGESTMMRSGFTRFLVSSRFSRALYGTSKAIVFCWLGGLIALRAGMREFSFTLPDDLMFTLDLVGQILVWVTLAMCVIRGLPVLWDGRRFLLEKRYPKAMVKQS